MHTAITAFNGFCMSIADSVPGVSGGTIAFILGFYEQLINALHMMFSKDLQQRKNAWLYLLKLGIGWAIGITLSVITLSKVFDANVYFMSSTFCGLTLGAIPMIIKSEKRSLQAKHGNLIFSIIGLVLVIGLALIRSQGAYTMFTKLSALNVWQYTYLFLVGAISIIAMVLPGISGSTLLLIFGVYLPAINALNSLIALDFSVLPAILTLAVGAVFGITLSIRFIRRALRQHRSAMIYMILGLMAGSIYAIMMGPTTLSVPQAPLSWASFSVPGFVLGLIILLALETIRRVIAKKEAAVNVGT